MVNIVLIFSTVALILSTLALIVGILALVELRSFNKSTHRVQYLPLSPPKKEFNTDDSELIDELRAQQRFVYGDEPLGDI